MWKHADGTRMVWTSCYNNCWVLLTLPSRLSRCNVRISLLKCVFTIPRVHFALCNFLGPSLTVPSLSLVIVLVSVLQLFNSALLRQQLTFLRAFPFLLLSCLSILLSSFCLTFFFLVLSCSFFFFFMSLLSSFFWHFLSFLAIFFMAFQLSISYCFIYDLCVCHHFRYPILSDNGASSSFQKGIEFALVVGFDKKSPNTLQRFLASFLEGSFIMKLKINEVRVYLCIYFVFCILSSFHFRCVRLSFFFPFSLLLPSAGRTQSFVGISKYHHLIRH